LNFQSIRSFISTTIHQRFSLVIIILGRVCIALAAVISVRISTNMLTPGQLGSLAQLISFYTFFIMLLLIPVTHYITRGFLEWHDSNQIVKISKLFFAYIFILSIFSTVVSGAIQWKWNIVNGFSVVSVFVLTGLAILANAFKLYGTTGLNLLNQRGKFVLFSILSAWCSLGISALLFLRYKELFYWNLGQTLGLMVGCFSIFFLMKHLKSTKENQTIDHTNTIPFTAIAIFKFSWPIIIISGLCWIQSQSYKFILDKVQGIENVGFFVIGYNLAAGPIAIYETVMCQYLEPIFFAELKNQGEVGQTKAWNNYARRYLPGLVVMGVFIACSAPFLAEILVGNGFRATAIKVASWAAIIETMRAACAMMYHLGMAKVDNRRTILPVAFGAVLATLGVFFLGRLDPILGTLTGLFIARLIELIIIMVSSRWVLPISWPIKEVFISLAFSIPLVIFFSGIFYFYHSLNFFSSFTILSIGGSYLAFIQVRLLLANKIV
jgi:O-antigen/teichoic acid export membrane protein